MVEHYDVIIIGGGLAGLTAAIHLSKEQHSVLVIERKTYPHHKVCGEYVSNEILPYLNSLGITPMSTGAKQIKKLQLSTVSGRSAATQLPLGGFGISRYAFDHLMYEKAIASGVIFAFESVVSIEYETSKFQVFTENNKSYTSNLVIGAYGKRSLLDKQLSRDFINQKSTWLGVKAHYAFDDFPDDKVALHNFKGGYGGLSKTESGAVNFCYLASYENFKKAKSVAVFNEQVVSQNPFLNEFLSKAVPLFKEPLTIAQISFDQKKAVENHILMCGDTAGLIHPLCGNGMAMAIHSAKIASECIHVYLIDDQYDRSQLEADYTKAWSANFKHRLWMGRRMQSLFLNEKRSNLALKTVVKSPLLLRKLIKSTHGKPIIC